MPPTDPPADYTQFSAAPPANSPPDYTQFGAVSPADYTPCNALAPKDSSVAYERFTGYDGGASEAAVVYEVPRAVHNSAGDAGDGQLIIDHMISFRDGAAIYSIPFDAGFEPCGLTGNSTASIVARDSPYDKGRSESGVISATNSALI